MNALIWVLAAVAAAQEISIVLMVITTDRKAKTDDGAGERGEDIRDRLIRKLIDGLTDVCQGYSREIGIYEKEREVLWRKNEQLQKENDAQKARLDRMVKEITAMEQRLDEE